MPRRVVLHIGFHKTGTTSIQRTLRTNRAVLKAKFIQGLKWRFPLLINAARGYSTYGDAMSLAKFSIRLDALLAELPAFKHRGFVMTCEELAGHIPGRAELQNYGAAVALMKEIREAFERRYERPDLHFVFTTRAPEPWLESAYWEHVKSSSMTLSLEEFRAQFSEAAQFTKVLDEIEKVVAPYPLSRIALEDCADHRLGPADPILRLAGLTDDDLANLEAIGPANTRLPQNVLDGLLAINRQEPDSAKRRAAKAAFLETFESDGPKSDG